MFPSIQEFSILKSLTTSFHPCKFPSIIKVSQCPPSLGGLKINIYGAAKCAFGHTYGIKVVSQHDIDFILIFLMLQSYDLFLLVILFLGNYVMNGNTSVDKLPSFGVSSRCFNRQKSIPSFIGLNFFLLTVRVIFFVYIMFGCFSRLRLHLFFWTDSFLFYYNFIPLNFFNKIYNEVVILFSYLCPSVMILSSKDHCNFKLLEF